MIAREQANPLNPYSKDRLIYESQKKQIWLIKNFQKQGFILKIEKLRIVKLNNDSKFDPLLNEILTISKMLGHIGCPLAFWGGTYKGAKLVIIEELGDTLLYKYETICKKKISIKTICMLGIQILTMLQILHTKGYIHRNIKARSFQFGKGKNSHKIYFNDFSDSKPVSSIKNLSNELQLKNDLFDVFKMLLDFTGTSISIQSFNKQKLRLNKKLPQQLIQMTIAAHQQSDNINHKWYTTQFKKIMYRLNYQNDFIYDWYLVQNTYNNLKINKIIPSLTLQQDDIKLKSYYDPFQANIEVDKLQQKYVHLMTEAIATAAETQSQAKTQYNQINPRITNQGDQTCYLI